MHYVERGNPYALLFHKGIDLARGRNGAEGIRGNKKRMAHCNGEHRGSKFALARKGADLFQVFHGKIGGIPVNDLYSTTEGKTSEKQSDEAKLGAQWKSIDWRRAKREVNRLQVRIVKATQQNDYNAVKRLQYLLTHSFYAKALAVKRVVTNDGRRTPGVDGVLWNTPAKKMKAVLSLTDKGYRARPLRRVYIEKKDKKKKRPLGIPTMYDRAMQALYDLALVPVAETTADGKSFGFRKGRCAQDACEYLFTALSRKHISPKWILEGDIKGCFDHISHDWLLANIPMDKSILKQFRLK